jgi:hypothetical protein
MSTIATSCPAFDGDETPIRAVGADYSKFDSAADIMRDATNWGLADELKALFCTKCRRDHGDALRLARDIAYEFAGAKDRDLAVDLFIRATGLGVISPASLRDYGKKHGCCYEDFRQKAEAMRKRLNLPAIT